MQAIARLHAHHADEATLLERLVETLTALIGRPAGLLGLLLVAGAWAAANTLSPRLGFIAPDPPPFSWLQGTISMLALMVTIIVLTTQRRADKLASQHDQLALELAILGEQKTAKVIDLLEEMRRDHPQLRDRRDDQAEAMARPSDPERVLEAIVAAPRPEDPDPDAQPRG